MSGERILVVDDEPQITRILRRTLSAHKYDVRTASDGESGFDSFRDFGPELVITDLQMPDMSGLELCREIRRFSQIPIIVLSVKGEEDTKVAALDAGADDYVMKPFGMDELMARIRAALRRSSAEQAEIKMQTTAGPFSVDLETYKVTVRGDAIHLTPKELELLVYFLKNEGKVLSHRNILSAIWGANSVEQTEYLRVFVGNLRKKIETDPSHPIHILTEPWVGYRFIAEPDEAV